ncbi:transcription antiterminator BlgG [Rhodococcus sp. AD45-ID]|uniref:ABC transporter substrate-binding protein n=1 Tax=unclassified Rhodococcus (in: high G+C Gram-positive bacteria) TaxID=192944 RepID=UPI0005D30ABD|nr:MULTISPECIES: ABC transporter substrate-binding protein [unclassified Rhodococcus (in: high G+C Gram-positive bacteria)]KJF24218.1 Hemin-binding lipoprotein [Rhodococcus sp. AD45]PSR42537.1 transcription antiterminator BlgG [Rhodococcus sp. AD45-ID]
MKFSRRLTALVGLATASILVLAGCSSAGGSTSGDAVVKWGQAGVAPGNWDPIVTGATGATVNLTPIYEPLLTQDENGKPAPALAESWEYNAEGTAVTFTLRAGLTFQDDTPVDAEAVAYYINRAITQKNSALAGSYSNIKDVVVDDELHFTVNLKSVDYQIPYLFSIRAGLITSQAAAEKDVDALNTRNPVGAGPFKVVELVPESHIILEKFQNYWDADNIHIDRLEISFGNDSASLVSAVQTGVYNFVSLDPTQIQNARTAGLDIVSDITKNWSIQFLSVNRNLAPFTDPRVVEAFRLAVDSQEFVDTGTLGEGEVAHQLLPEGHPLFADQIEGVFTYNPTKAKELLSEAGYPTGLDITLEAFPGASDANSELIQSQLAAIGVKVTINKNPNWAKGYFGKTQAFSFYGYVGRNSQAQTLTEHYDVGGVLNLSSPITSDAFQKALADLRATPIESPDYLEKARAASTAGFLEGSSIPLVALATTWAKSPEISSDFQNREGFLNWRGITVGSK